MSFYCLYCNRTRSGNKNTEQGKTREHFIPTSIGGIRCIPLCQKCNKLLGETHDNYLFQLSWMFEFYKNRCIKRNGQATLRDGHKVDIKFSYKEKLSHKKVNFELECYTLYSEIKIPKTDIKSIEFKLESKTELVNSYRSILKIALGGGHYLNTRYKLTEKGFFSDLAFAGIREEILGKGNFEPGGNGRSSPVKCELLSTQESERIIAKHKNKDDKVRHLISVGKEDENLEINICLFNFFFWRVTVHMNNSVRFKKIEEEFILYNLNKTTRMITSSIMQHESPPTIIIIINE